MDFEQGLASSYSQLEQTTLRLESPRIGIDRRRASNPRTGLAFVYNGDSSPTVVQSGTHFAVTVRCRSDFEFLRDDLASEVPGATTGTAGVPGQEGNP